MKNIPYTVSLLQYNLNVTFIKQIYAIEEEKNLETFKSVKFSDFF